VKLVASMGSTTEPGRSSQAREISTRDVVYMAIGAALYGVLGWISAVFRIPGPFNTSIRPAIVIPMFFGGVFGRRVGFFTGFVGNAIIDLLSGYGFSWNWSLGNGLMGWIAGNAVARCRTERIPELREVMAWSTGGMLLAFLFSSVTDIWVYQTQPSLVPLQYAQVIIPNMISGVILLPVLYAAYGQIVDRSGR